MKYLILLICFSFVSLLPAEDNSALDALRQSGKIFSKVAKKSSPSVVMIKTEKEVSPYMRRSYGSPFQDDFFRRFFDLPNQPQQRTPQKPAPKRKEIVGQGSGFIISEDGYILTNNHVIGDADGIIVNLLDGREFKAELIGADPQSDVAVIKIKGKPENLPVAELGSSEKVEVGEWVLALGNPFGLSHSVTAGIISAKDRNSVGITDYEDFIQTDAAINPGNSGGPLVNLEGKVIGINTAIYSRSGGYMGIGFAIPIDMVIKIKDQLINKGSVSRGFLGVLIQDLNSELSKSFDVKKGVLISKVTKNSPAEKAGIEAGDVVIEFNGKEVPNVGAFRNMVSMIEPGKSVKVIVDRRGDKETLTVKIGSLNDELADSSGSYGFSVAENDNEYKTDHKGVVITQVQSGSIAEAKGLKKGMVISEVNRVKVNDVSSFKSALTKKHDQALLLVHDEYGSRFIVLKKEK